MYINVGSKYVYKIIQRFYLFAIASIYQFPSDL